jgi:5-methylcytosine-specific restriction endonuclease McrA
MRRPDSFYLSHEWRGKGGLREQVLARDNYRCVTPGCGAKASTVDHIVSRRVGGQDQLGNLRSLCRACDNRLKEDATGRRRSGGAVHITGIDGWPIEGGK